MLLDIIGNTFGPFQNIPNLTLTLQYVKQHSLSSNLSGSLNPAITGAARYTPGQALVQVGWGEGALLLPGIVSSVLCTEEDCPC